MPEVFISHSSKDRPAALATLSVLEQRGISCWIAPRDIVPGTEYGAAILKGIEDCSMFLLIFSGNANQSPQVRREVERAVSKGLVIIPVRIEDVVPQAALEYFLSSPHWLDAFPEPFEHYLESLAESVSAFLQHREPPSSAVAASQALPARLMPAPHQQHHLRSSGKRVSWTVGAALAAGAVLALGGGWFLQRVLYPPPGDSPPGQPPVEDVKPNPGQPESPVPPAPPAPVPGTDDATLIPFTGIPAEDRPKSGTLTAKDKLEGIILPLFELKGISLPDAIEQLRTQSQAADVNEPDPARKGIPILMSEQVLKAPATSRLTMALKDVPLGEAIRYTTELAGVKFTVEPYAVRITSSLEAPQEMTTRIYPLNRELYDAMPVEAAQTLKPDPFAPPGTYRTLVPAKNTARRWLEAQGISFPEGASATLNEKEGTLTVTNTAVNHELIANFIALLYETSPGNLKRPAIPPAVAK